MKTKGIEELEITPDGKWLRLRMLDSVGKRVTVDIPTMTIQPTILDLVSALRRVEAMNFANAGNLLSMTHVTSRLIGRTEDNDLVVMMLRGPLGEQYNFAIAPPDAMTLASELAREAAKSTGSAGQRPQ